MKRLKINIDQTIRLGYGIAFLLLIVSYGFFFLSLNQSKSETELVAHTYIVTNKLDHLLSDVKDIETGFRGYVAMNDELFLASGNVRNKIHDSLDTLHNMLADNPGQLVKLKELKSIVSKRIAIIDSAANMFQRYGKITDSMKTLAYHGKAVMDRLMLIVSQMQQTETKLLIEREHKLASINNSTKVIAFVSLLLALILICYSIITFNRENKAKKMADSHAALYYRQLEERIEELHLKNAELSELRNLEKFAATGRMARTMAHEIKNPLNNINLAMEQIKDYTENSEDISSLLGIALKNTGRINQLITDLLNSTRFLELRFERVPVNKLLDESIEIAKDGIQLHNIKLVKNYGDEVYISADKEKIKIAFLNIIINAAEAINSDEGVIEIKTELRTGKCIITVTDNGIGMNDEMTSRLFEPFVTTKPTGTGLGLTNTKNIILNHRGVISVLSNPGKGTSFSIVLNALQV